MPQPYPKGFRDDVIQVALIRDSKTTIAQNRVWTGACTASAGARNLNIGQHVGQDHSVVALAASDHDRQWSTSTVDGMVDLHRQTATRAADPVRLARRPQRADSCNST